MKIIYVTYAVKEEYIPLSAEGCDILHIQTGVGKTKSATALTKNICQKRPDLVLNIGTAGTLNHEVGDIFVSNSFVDRDYKVIRLPGIEYEIDGIKLLENTPYLKSWLTKYHKQGICSTGDTFVTEAGHLHEDFVDMEAYAQAYVCKEFNVPFISIKYITDIIGENSVEIWENKLAEACTGLSLWFNENSIFTLMNK